MFLNKNIKTPNKNAFYNLIIGFVFWGMTFWVFKESAAKENGIDQFDWIYIGMFGIVGLFFVYKGLNSIIRKAYIHVDEDKISIKPDESSKSETIFWKDIDSIRSVGNNYDIVKKNFSTYTIYFSYYDYANAQDLKRAIDEMAAEKGISISETAN